MQNILLFDLTILDICTSPPKIELNFLPTFLCPTRFYYYHELMLFLILCPPCNAINLTRGDRTLYSNDTNLGSMESNMFGVKDSSVPVL